MTSASGLLALLEESDDRLKIYALENLYSVVDQYWCEISSSIPLIESLSEDDSFSKKGLAAAIASKCFFHLEEYSDALRLALAAGQYFDVNSHSEYVDSMVSRCIDEYTALRIEAEEGGGDVKDIDPRMEAVVERMFERCFTDGKFMQAVGIAIESRRFDKLETALSNNPAPAAALSETAGMVTTLLGKSLRVTVLELLCKLWPQLVAPADIDYTRLAQCQAMLGRSEAVAGLLEGLLKGSAVDELTAYQVAFDLYDNDDHEFLLAVNRHLPGYVAQPAAGSGAEESKEGDAPAPAADAAAAAAATADGAAMETEGAAAAAAEKELPLPEGAPEDYWGRMKKLRSVVAGGFAQELQLDILYRQSASDANLMKALQTAVEGRNSVLHGSAVVAHGYMNSGTTRDKFLRDNLEWMGRANHWAKFTATASIGVIHKGHVKESMSLLQPYLPSPGVSSSPFSEGGGLYALGLIHCSSGAAANDASVKYLLDSLKNAGTQEPVQHGACLGLGLAAMGSARSDVLDELRNVLYTDNAVAGEGAGIGMGLLLLGKGSSGSGNELSSAAVQDMLAYAKDTKHEKIIRGLALGVALVCYGQEGGADGVIEQMVMDKDPVVRYGGMFVIGMAYSATADNGAVRRLLHVAVSDVSDDVRRAAVMCLGFVLLRAPEQVPSLVALLSQSFNPHVRYGACMAVGIACAATASASARAEAVNLLEPMTTADPVDFVRQGACLALSMVLMQEAEGKISKVKTFREKLLSVARDKHQSVMYKMGAVLSQGLLDAGGRNVSIQLVSRAGFRRSKAIVGMMMWLQHWYWYPLLHFVSLSFSPTAAVGLNRDLALPTDFSLRCNARPSHYAYPKELEEKKEEAKELVATAVLSTTARHKAKEAKKGRERDTESSTATDASATDADAEAYAKANAGASMDVEGDDKKKEGKPAEVKAGAEEEKAGEEKTGAAEKDGAKPKEKEAAWFLLKNPSRVTNSQRAVVTLVDGQRYVPVRKGRAFGGVMMLRDTTPGNPEDVVEVTAPVRGDVEEEAEPPEPFEWEPPAGQS